MNKYHIRSERIGGYSTDDKFAYVDRVYEICKDDDCKEPHTMFTFPKYQSTIYDLKDPNETPEVQ